MVYIRNVVEPVLFLYMFSDCLNIITLQSLVYERTCLKTLDPDLCPLLNNGSFQHEEVAIQVQTSKWVLHFNMALLIPSIIAALFLGPFGDAFSRKIVLILPIIGNITAIFVFLIISAFDNIPVIYLLIGVVLNGCCGGHIVMMMALYSYIVHITDLKYRTIRLGILESMVFLSTTIGMLVAGMMLKSVGHTAMYGIISIFNILNLFYTVFVVEELIETDKSTRKILRSIFLIENIKSLCKFMTQKRKSNTRTVLLFGILILSVLILMTKGEFSIIQLFLRHSPISASVTQIGYFFSLQNFVYGFTLIIILPLLKKCFSVNDFALSLVGFAAQGIGSIMFGLAQNITTAFIVPVVKMPLGFTYATIRSVTSTFVNIDEEAKLFTFMAYLENLMALLASVCFNGLYSLTFDIHQGFVFFVSTAICSLCTLFTVVMWFQIKQANGYKNLDEHQELQRSGK
ncbi:proton-coupled folate transporter [Octopus bimaculoides]|uniref:Major facilitator superfamily (MFS) profile domain-containing protein n=1 Tax=Octopus bimaculoides TaxID=37653 RepID=A0A0L8GRR7_OCTBM|nr:proton-coupled folate transporter [Octopus bimaculoides]XP_014778617.1 proton-coupled folate transporter [Octopus bimaculoides]|eukprot:XP_014778616.1 PREDICTED: proton-coupled folate transporter-like [Octopus bimaculoides]